MSAGFTPGPWLIHAKHRWIVPAADAFKDAAEALPICQLRDPDERLTEDETLANGFLMSAAPELYEALENIIFGISQGSVGKPAVTAGVAALRKARGETPNDGSMPSDD